MTGSALSKRPGELPRVEPMVIARNGSPWLLAEFMPMTSFAHDLFNGGDTLLYFTNLVVEGAASEQLLRCTFQLTAAEARLASGLASLRNSQGSGTNAKSCERLVTLGQLARHVWRGATVSMRGVLRSKVCGILYFREGHNGKFRTERWEFCNL